MRLVIAKPYRNLLFHWHGNCGSVESACWGISLNYPCLKLNYAGHWAGFPDNRFYLSEHWIVGRTWFDFFWSSSGAWFRLFGYGLSVSTQGIYLLRKRCDKRLFKR